MGNGAKEPFLGALAVVTGAGQGIGAAIARGLARNGAHVVVSGRRAVTLESVCSAITAEGGSADYCVGDVTDPAPPRASHGIGGRTDAACSTSW